MLLPRSCVQPKKRASAIRASSSRSVAFFTLSGSHFRTSNSMISAVSRRCIQSGSQRLVSFESVLPARNFEWVSFMPRLLFVRRVLFSEIDIALCLYYKMDFCNFKAFFLYFFKASTDSPPLSIIFHGFVGKHKVSTRFLCTKKPPRLPVTETGAVRLRYGFLFALFKRSHDHLRGFLIAAWAGAKITERSQQ